MEYGKKLNPDCSLRMTRGIKGTRQKVSIMHNLSKIDQNHLLLMRFLNLGSDDIIILRMANLSFNIEFSLMADPKRALVSNVGRTIVQKLAVKFKGNEILGVDDFSMFVCYQDLWKTVSEKQNAVRQGIIHSGSCTENCMKLWMNASDKNASNKWDVAIGDVYSDTFVILLNFKMLDSMIPYYQSGLGNWLCYEITFKNYDRIIISPGSPAKPDAKYKIANVSLQYEIISQPDLARCIMMEHQSMALPYDRALRNTQIPVNKSDMTWSWSFNMPHRSLKGILVLFKAEQLYAWDTSRSPSS